jgi:hypothetical protein
LHRDHPTLLALRKAGLTSNADAQKTIKNQPEIQLAAILAALHIFPRF